MILNVFVSPRQTKPYPERLYTCIFFQNVDILPFPSPAKIPSLYTKGLLITWKYSTRPMAL